MPKRTVPVVNGGIVEPKKREVHEDEMVDSLLPILEENRRFTIELSPHKNDTACKISIGAIDVLLTRDQMKALIAEL